MSAHPARFSPEDKFSRERITIKKRFGLLPTQHPAPKYWAQPFALHFFFHVYIQIFFSDNSKKCRKRKLLLRYHILSRACLRIYPHRWPCRDHPWVHNWVNLVSTLLISSKISTWRPRSIDPAFLFLVTWPLILTGGSSILIISVNYISTYMGRTSWNKYWI